MSQKKSAKIQQHFVMLTDPRRRKVTYPLINIVVIAVCAVICGADDFVAIADFGRTKRKWFARFLDLKSGIPSHDRFNAVLARVPSLRRSAKRPFGFVVRSRRPDGWPSRCPSPSDSCAQRGSTRYYGERGSAVVSYWRAERAPGRDEETLGRCIENSCCGGRPP